MMVVSPTHLFMKRKVGITTLHSVLSKYTDCLKAGFTFCGLGCLSFLDRLPPREAPNTSSHLTNKHATITGPSDPNAVISWLVSRQTATITEEDEFDTHADETDTPTTCHDTHSFVLPEKFTSDTGKQSHDTRPSRDFALDWTGFNGRCNKIADTCYAFWVEGALEVELI